MFSKKLKLFSLSLALTYAATAWADINSDLTTYFNGLGLDSNVTAPQAYKGQQAGYYTGGSIFARNSVRDVQIANIQLPSYNAGCGGIDLFGGGFSFINADALVGMMKNVLNNAKGYAFNLAMESATPEIANTMKYITDMANKVNQANVNSCETAASLVGSVWPRTNEAQRHVCADIGANKGLFDDYAAARQGCGKGGQMSNTLREGLKDDKFKNLVLDNGNLAWKAIQQNSFLQKDTQLAELFMSLSGSIIIRKNGNDDNATNQISILLSVASRDTLIKALLYGDNADIWHCDTTDENGCLNPQKTTVTINPNNALQTRVKEILNRIVDKIYADQPLVKDELGLLNSTRLPVYKMLNVQAAFSRDKSIVNVADYADVIATDILFQYLNESLMVVQTSAGSLQYPAEILSQFQKQVDKSLEAVRAAQGNAYKQVNLSLQMIQNTQAIEQMLAGQLSTELASTISWARGLH
jgi:conjugative transfer pilus assembly protein TraH